jgi:hypothetical protein
VGRSDLDIILPDEVRLVIEVKYRKKLASENQDLMQKELAAGLKDAKTSILTKDYSGPWILHAKRVIAISLAIYDRIDVSAEFVEV